MGGQGLIYAFILDGKGGARSVGWDEFGSWTPDKGVLWLHFDYSAPEARRWIVEESGLDEVSAEALLTEETRPRTTVNDDAALLALRGVNMNPGSDPEDMVSIRVWVDRHRIISTRNRRLLSVTDIVDSLEKERGPKTSGQFLVALTDHLTSRMEGTVEEIEDRVAQVEESIVDGGSHAIRSEISGVRREAIMLRRYLAPQREAMLKLSGEKLSWMDSADQMRLREVTDQLIRYIEDLDSARDRASVTQEELVNRLSEQMNTRMYVLSVIAAMFLPLGFLTGLLGINLGGIPGSENPRSFLIFILFLILVAGFQILIFRKKKWF